MYVYIFDKAGAPDEVTMPEGRSHTLSNGWELCSTYISDDGIPRHVCVLCTQNSHGTPHNRNSREEWDRWKRLTDIPVDDSYRNDAGGKRIQRLIPVREFPHTGHDDDYVAFDNVLFSFAENRQRTHVVVSPCPLDWNPRHAPEGRQDGEKRVCNHFEITINHITYASRCRAGSGVTLYGRHLEREGVDDTGRRGLRLRSSSVVCAPGTVTALVGQSGSGKSTLLDALSGMGRATRGDVLVNGVSFYDNPDYVRGCMAYVPQNDLLHPQFTVFQELQYTAELRCPKTWTRDRRMERIFSVVQDLGIRGILNHRTDEVSGGQRKRVAIACALLAEPKVIFLDEPTSPLDPGLTAAFVRDDLGRIAKTGCTVVFVTHDLDSLTTELAPEDSKSQKLGYVLVDQLVYLDKGYRDSEEGRNYRQRTGREVGSVVYEGEFRDFSISYVDDGKPDSELRRVKNSRRDLKQSFDRGYQSVRPPVDPRGTEPANPFEGMKRKPPIPAADRPGALLQFWIGIRRALRNLANSPGSVLLQMLMPLVIGLILGLVSRTQKLPDSDAYQLYQDANFTMNMMFTFSCGAFFIGVFSSLHLFSDRRLLSLEQYHGLRTIPYALSVFTVQTAVCAVQSVILYASFVWSSGVSLADVTNPIIKSGFDMLVVIFACMESAMVMGLLVSVLFVSPTLVAPLLVLLQIVFSGIVFSLDGAAKKLSYLVSCQWSVVGLSVVVDQNKLYRDWNVCGGMCDTRYEQTVGNYMMSILWLFILTVVMLVLLLVIMTRRNKKQYAAESSNPKVAAVRAFLKNARMQRAVLVASGAVTLVILLWTGGLLAGMRGARDFDIDFLKSIPEGFRTLVDDFRNTIL